MDTEHHYQTARHMLLKFSFTKPNKPGFAPAISSNFRAKPILFINSQINFNRFVKAQ